MRKALYILGDLNDHDITWLAETGERQTVAAGTVVIRQDAPLDSLYFVIDGSLGVYLGDGTQVAELGAGDIVGEMSLVEKRPPTVSVKALSDCRLLSVPQGKLRAELERKPDFAARFYRAIAVFLSDRLRSTVSQLGYGTPSLDNARQAFEAEHELDDGLLDNIHVAGDRLLRLIAILDGRRA